MTTQDQFASQLRNWLHQDATGRLPDSVLQATFERTRQVGQQRVWLPDFAVWRPGRRLALAATGAMLIVAFAIGAWAGSVFDPDETPTPTASPSAQPSTSPSAPPAAVAPWAPDSVNEDWPGQVRAEPTGQPTIVPGVNRLAACEQADHPYRQAFLDVAGFCPSPEQLADAQTREELAGLAVFLDGRGDVAPVSSARVDIDAISYRYSRYNCTPPRSYANVSFRVEDGVSQPLEHPTDTWMAWGITFDLDRDGVADIRYGMDNAGEERPGEGEARMWWTDLRTSETRADRGLGGWQDLGWNRGMDATLPEHREEGSAWGNMYFHQMMPTPAEVTRPAFYLWASLIRDGHVVASDFAPDEGWLEMPTSLVACIDPGATPSDSLVLEPLEPGVDARRLYIEVDNRDVVPARLLVTFNRTRPREQIGDAIPAVVEAGTRARVVLTVPGGDVRDLWALFVNGGPLIRAADVRRCVGETGIVVQLADGMVTWTYPNEADSCVTLAP